MIAVRKKETRGICARFLGGKVEREDEKEEIQRHLVRDQE
jgi:hypothetical protein